MVMHLAIGVRIEEKLEIELKLEIEIVIIKLIIELLEIIMMRKFLSLQNNCYYCSVIEI